MSSPQDHYYYSDTSPTSYESGTEHAIGRQSHSPGPSWIPSITTGDQRDPQPYQTLNQTGNLLVPDNVEGTGYFNQTYPDYPSQGTLFQGPAMTDATFDNGSRFDFTDLPQSFYPAFQPQSSYSHYDQGSDFSGQPFVHTSNVHPMNDPTQSQALTVFQQDIRIPPISQGPSAPVFPYPPAQFLALDHRGPMYGESSRSARPAIGSLTPEGVNTARVDLPNTDAGRHSHPSPVATSPSNHGSSPGPSRLSPTSPDRKRPLPLAADAEPSAGRRVFPRTHRALSVHSTSSDGHRHRRSTDVLGRGPLIPQDRYTTSSISAYNMAEQHPPITFNLDNPNQIGIPITDILNRTNVFDRIREGTHSFSHMGKKTFTLRVQWPGYKPWSKTIAALDWKKSRAPIQRVKLAEAVATGIKNLIEKKRDEPCDPDYAEWNVGPNGIQLEQLCLVALHQVSRGSWQPQLCLLGPRR